MLADRLITEGHPRGELINVQCELTRLDPAHPRRLELQRREHDLLKDSEHWVRGVCCEWKRGCVDGILIDGAVKPGPPLLGLRALLLEEPVRRLRIAALDDDLARQLAPFPELRRLAELEVQGVCGEEPLGQLIDAFPALRVLKVERGGDSLAHAAELQHLEELELSNAGGSRSLEAAGGFRSLKRLTAFGMSLSTLLTARGATLERFRGSGRYGPLASISAPRLKHLEFRFEPSDRELSNLCAAVLPSLEHVILRLPIQPSAEARRALLRAFGSRLVLECYRPAVNDLDLGN